jgi:hypothetical protein
MDYGKIFLDCLLLNSEIYLVSTLSFICLTPSHFSKFYQLHTPSWNMKCWYMRIWLNSLQLIFPESNTKRFLIFSSKIMFCIHVSNWILKFISQNEFLMTDNFSRHNIYNSGGIQHPIEYTTLHSSVFWLCIIYFPWVPARIKIKTNVYSSVKFIFSI